MKTSYECIKTYAMPFHVPERYWDEELGMMVAPKKPAAQGAPAGGGPASSTERPDREVDRRAKLYMADHKGTRYAEALKKVLAADPALKRAYAKGE